MPTPLRHLAIAAFVTLAWICTPDNPCNGTPFTRSGAVADTTEKDLDAQQALAFIQAHPQAIILDVRTPDEYAAGHINKSRNINVYDTTFAAQVVALDRSKTYVVHCAAGPRSRKAVAIMESLGFKHIHHLNGGFNGWKQAGQPVVKQ
ncbi:rhodanese-like domain-containing protein [Fibrella sp. ES10-3-2-2]|nr:hypothetical protein A6C57_18540 [Fibrella sp. ES10-3-2-2]